MVDRTTEMASPITETVRQTTGMANKTTAMVSKTIETDNKTIGTASKTIGTASKITGTASKSTEMVGKSIGTLNLHHNVLPSHKSANTLTPDSMPGTIAVLRQVTPQLTLQTRINPMHAGMTTTFSLWR